MAVFQTERMRVRELRESDGDHFFLLNGSEEVMRYVRPIKTKEESDAHFEKIRALRFPDPSNGAWIVEERDNGAFMGTFGIFPFEIKEGYSQLGYSFIPAYWGRGLATELVKAGLDYFAAHSRQQEIYAVTDPKNRASVRVLEKSGFVLYETFMEEETLLNSYCASW